MNILALQLKSIKVQEFYSFVKFCRAVATANIYSHMYDHCLLTLVCAAYVALHLSLHEEILKERLNFYLCIAFWMTKDCAIKSLHHIV